MKKEVNKQKGNMQSGSSYTGNNKKPPTQKVEGEFIDYEEVK
ncbi:MAG TPA: hypothetical protein PKX92_08320 [Edaphocola sp.]|nr:hypothetical protein [Edaphocola sp.]